MLILVVALITNNIQRRYPVFWFKPTAAAPQKPSPAPEVEIKRPVTPASHETSNV